MNFFNQVKINVINNYQGVLVILSLLIILFNIIQLYFINIFNKVEKNSQLDKSLSSIFYKDVIVFILLSIFIGDFIYNKRYTITDVSTQSTNVISSLFNI